MHNYVQTELTLALRAYLCADLCSELCTFYALWQPGFSFDPRLWDHSIMTLYKFDTASASVMLNKEVCFTCNFEHTVGIPIADQFLNLNEQLKL